MNKETRKKIDAIVAEARDHGIAFVEDEFIITDNGEEVYNPTVDRMNAEAWLLNKLVEII